MRPSLAISHAAGPMLSGYNTSSTVSASTVVVHLLRFRSSAMSASAGDALASRSTLLRVAPDPQGVNPNINCERPERLNRNRPDQHRLFADPLTAEYRVKTEGRGRTVDEWKLRPEKGDNHWFDCLVGCAVAGSIQGVSLMDQTPKSKPRARRRMVHYLFQ
ncbi:MAG: terminase gpA endonuclease subunit [Planctomycetaceae bacterium]